MPAKIHLVLLAGLALAAGQAAPAQAVPVGSFGGLVDGRVVASGTFRPLRGVILRLERSGTDTQPGTSWETITRDGGGFRFDELPPGPYHFKAYKPGYGSYGSQYSLILAPDDQVRGVQIEMQPPGVITGIVRDSEGRVVPGVKVHALRRYTQFNESWFREWESSETDDAGRYRIHGLFAGRYYVRARAARLGRDDFEIYPQTYHPNVSDLAQAAAIRLGWDSVVDGVDIELPPPARTLVAGGVVDSASGARCSQCVVGFSEASAPYVRRSLRTGGDGGFRIQGLAPARYRFVAEHGEPPVFASEEIQVAANRVSEVLLALRPGIQVSGRIRIDRAPGSTVEPSPSSHTSIQLLSSGPSVRLRDTGTSQVEQEGTFVLENVPPGRMKLQTNCGVENGYPAGIAIAGRDLPSPHLDVFPGMAIENVELRCGFERGGVKGTIKPSAQAEPFERIPNVSVWYVPQGGPDSFQFAGAGRAYGRGPVPLEHLLPGRYRLYALSNSTTTDLFDPEAQRILAPYGQTVEVTAGEMAEVELIYVPSSVWLP